MNAILLTKCISASKLVTYSTRVLYHEFILFKNNNNNNNCAIHLPNGIKLAILLQKKKKK